MALPEPALHVAQRRTGRAGRITPKPGARAATPAMERPRPSSIRSSVTMSASVPARRQTPPSTHQPSVSINHYNEACYCAPNICCLRPIELGRHRASSRRWCRAAREIRRASSRAIPRPAPARRRPTPGGKTTRVSACPLWVKSGKAQNEQMLSALPPRADIASLLPYVRFVADSCTAAMPCTGLQGLAGEIWRRFNLEILNWGTSPADPSSSATPRRVRVIMSHTFKSELVQECYLRAAEARQIAKAASDPFTKADFVALERRWLSLARRYECEERWRARKSKSRQAW